MFRGFGSILYKEVIQVSRDPFALLLMLGIPMIQLTIFGFAINTNVRNIKTAVYDLDRRREARQLVNTFQNTGYFRITEYVHSDAELDRAIVSGRVKIGIKIPRDYSDRLGANGQAAVLVLIDGSDSSIATQSLTVSIAIGFNQSLAQLLRHMTRRGSQLPVEIRPKMLFNPDSRSANFMVPGLVAIILQVITTFLTSFSIVRERERGTLEQLLVTPVRPLGLMLGKLVPYGLIGFFETCTVLLVMRVVFNVPINGSVALLLVLSLVFLFTSLATGLLISTFAENQVQALQMAWLILLPSVLLSGFMFPRDSMPGVIQAVSYLIPATHFVEIIRGIVLRGAPLVDLLPHVEALAGIGLAVFLLSALRFYKKVA